MDAVCRTGTDYCADGCAGQHVGGVVPNGAETGEADG
jgi:hypothetical protein